MMKKSEQIGLDFEVDKLTHSIENMITGDSFATDIIIISISDLKNVTKKSGWQFIILPKIQTTGLVEKTCNFTSTYEKDKKSIYRGI